MPFRESFVRSMSDEDLRASSNLSDDHVETPSKVKGMLPVPIKTPFILKNRIKNSAWNRIRKFCSRNDTKCAVFDFFKKSVFGLNPFVAFFILGSVYALATTCLFLWYVQNKCENDDSEGFFLCGPLKFAIIPPAVIVPSLSPGLYLLFLVLSENNDMNALPPLLFRALYGYASLSYHFVHCSNAEALRHGLNEVIARSFKEERRAGRRKKKGKKPSSVAEAADENDDSSSSDSISASAMNEGNDDPTVSSAALAETENPFNGMDSVDLSSFRV